MEVAPQHESRGELVELLGEVASCSDRIACRERPGEGLRFSLLRNGEPTGISFRAVPTGHEFSSLLLAVLNADGQGKNFPDRSVCDRVRALNGPIRLTTYVSLTCTNCPDVVQALNAMATLNPGVEHETVDGAIHQAEVAALPTFRAFRPFLPTASCCTWGGAISASCLRSWRPATGSMPRE